MKIASIEAKNYKVLDNCLVPFRDGYCTISGKNNAGKSCIISLLSNLFIQESYPFWRSSQFELDYKEDKTQWSGDNEPIEIAYNIKLKKADDSALILFLEKMVSTSLEGDDFDLIIIAKASNTGEISYKISVGGKDVEEKMTREIIQKLKTSNLLFLHNSTSHEELYLTRGRKLALVEAVLSDDERRQIIDAEASVHNRIKKLAKRHKEELKGLLDRLDEKFSVEFSTIDAGYSRNIPLGVRLIDRYKRVDVPINQWGSGTQNKTYILLSILYANRIKTQAKAEEKTTPVVIIEEPESFLHPSAQAEFGRLLSSLAVDYGIQIIVTTHSPYMLNRNDIANNLLVQRKRKTSKTTGSEIIEPKGSEWMIPFSEHLGISRTEFDQWASICCSSSKRVLLVEGEIDKEYIEHLQTLTEFKQKLDSDIEIVPYGGKDTLKNTLLLKFSLSRYDKVFITFDLDALRDVQRSLESLGYENGKNYHPIGLDRNGFRDIEGLLPDRVRSKVYSEHTNLVAEALGGVKDSKDKLKKKLLAEFKAHIDYSDEELKHFNLIFRVVRKGIL